MAVVAKSSLLHKQIVLGVTGGIAAYKSADLVRRLREEGAVVQVVMTTNAQQFITPLTLQAVSGNPVRSNLFDTTAEAAMGHIELARWADLILIAPASADFMAKLASGRADDLLSTLCLATQASILLAPAMNQVMWQNTITQKNAQALLERNIKFIGPEDGSQACGEFGSGRMAEPTKIAECARKLFEAYTMAGLRVLITAGTTHEAIDPVRFISNASSGKMGYALAQAALVAGAEVTIVSGPVTISYRPEKASIIYVKSAQDMYEAVMRNIGECDIFFSVAAVADYRCKKPALQKIHKERHSLTLELERTPDIIAEVAGRCNKPFIVGFAAETENLLENAKHKKIRKGMDMVVANQVGNKNIGFDSDENEVIVLWQEYSKEFQRAPKTKLAQDLIDLVAKVYSQREGNKLRRRGIHDDGRM